MIARLALAAAAVGLVVLAFLRSAERPSPGPLSGVHAGVAELSGEGSCRRCHGGWLESLADACGGCHADVLAQTAGGTGFHGVHARGPGCGACHPEHHGSALAIAGERAWRLAGFPDPERFAHEGLGFALVGRHAALACAACHPHAGAEVLPAGEPRFAGLDQSCATCHADPHGGALSACADCHGQERPFPEAPGFEHTVRFPLAGAHAGLACAACHEPGTPRAFEALAAHTARGSRPPAPRACADCHESPHEAEFTARAAAELVLAAAASCAACHDAVPGGFSLPLARIEPAVHAAAARFPLDPPHEVGPGRLDCAACHAPHGSSGPERFAARFPGRAFADCAACHGDPHRGELAGRGCLECHDARRFLPVAFGVAEHARAPFPLDGAHAAVACGTCHAREPGVSGPPRFRDAPSECAACHADAHRGALPSDCGACHGTERFDARARGRFDHERWTDFPLAGAHAAAACESCHRPAARADASGRTLGFVSDRFGAPPEGERGFRGACERCHADPHDWPSPRAASSACAECHVPTRFADVERAAFDHAALARFPLDGAHARAACEACHPRAPEPDDRGRRFSRAAGTRCADCHADPHAGQFAPEGGPTDCSRCHSTSGAFAADLYEHGMSRFELDATHARLACSTCHVPSPLAGGGSAVRYRPLGVRCADCHLPGAGGGR